MSIKEKIVGKIGDVEMVKLADVEKAKQIISGLNDEKALKFIKENDLYPLISPMPFIESLFTKDKLFSAMHWLKEFKIELASIDLYSILCKMIENRRFTSLFHFLFLLENSYAQKHLEQLIYKLIDAGHIQVAFEWLSILEIDFEVIKQTIEKLIAKGDYDNAVRFVWEFDINNEIDLSVFKRKRLSKSARKLLLLKKRNYLNYK